MLYLKPNILGYISQISFLIKAHSWYGNRMQDLMSRGWGN